jgi:hypothetical protein
MTLSRRQDPTPVLPNAVDPPERRNIAERITLNRYDISYFPRFQGA